MNAHTLHTRFRSLLTIFTLALCIAGCRPAGEESEECQTDNEKIKPFLSEFNKNLDTLKKFSDWMTDKAKTEKDDVSAGANDYLKTLGYVSIAYAWIKVLEVSFKDYEENKNFYNDKIDTARFYFDKVLPRAEHHYKSAISGSSNIMNFKFN